MTAPLRIGLLGASAIAPAAIIGPARERGAMVVAVAASTRGRADAYAARHGLEAEVNYQALIARPDIDLIYNALTPSSHAAWTIAALQEGKAVLCEKPFAMSRAEAEAMAAASRTAGRPLIEAFHYSFHSLMRIALARVREGSLGKLLSAEARFSAQIPQRAGEFRWNAALGGGALMDLGCYCVHALRMACGGEPLVTSASARRSESADAAIEAELMFGDVPARLRADMEKPFAAQLVVVGEQGRMIVDKFVAPHRGGMLTFESGRGVEIISGESEPSSYGAQFDHVLAVMRGDVAPLTGGDDAVATMAVIEAIAMAAGLRPKP